MALPSCPFCNKRYGFDIYETATYSFSLVCCRHCGKAIGPIERSEIRQKNLMELVKVLQPILRR